MKRNAVIDNSFIVPNNPYLLLQYSCHINVEHTCQTSAIKYLFKYVHKRNDRVTASFYQVSDEGNEQVVDDIQNYYDCRHTFACESTWRLFGYDIQVKEPSVIRLPFHLPKEHPIIFRDDETIKDMVEGVVYDTFQDAYYALDLLQDDKEFIDAIMEASTWASGNYVRNLFVILLIFNNLSRPEVMEQKLQDNGKSLSEFCTLLYPSLETINGMDDCLIMDELNFDTVLLRHKLNHVSSFMIMVSLNINQNSICNIKQGSYLAMLVSRAKLIIWNETPMLNKYDYEALDKSLKDILRFDLSYKPDMPFGKKLIQISDGLASDNTDGELEVLIPNDLLIDDTEKPFDELVYLSFDSLCVEEGNMEAQLDTMPPDILNAINCSGLPPHQLILKEGVSVMLLRNIDQSEGLCNKIRLQICRLRIHVIECITLTGDKDGKVVLILWIYMIPNNDTPF
ncbi:uncharacterized protein LOC107640404 [Arachis ipaensis]|uniref:uncharacterized protein LOC107640404 n=1 Tax=Arachis ipaensis TaxID=130454 RepID=UPI0007AFAE05|nr:uncharacterized protein LOC107640404 [Arachis ipaensis]